MMPLSQADWHVRLAKRHLCIKINKDSPEYRLAAHSSVPRSRSPQPNNSRSVSKRHWEQDVMGWRIGNRELALSVAFGIAPDLRMIAILAFIRVSFRLHGCCPLSLVHMVQANNMTTSARHFQLVMELVHRWSLLVNGQHALCDAPRCGLCGTACDLSDLDECEQCGVEFNPYCCASCMSEDDQFLCYICFSHASPIWYVA